MVWYFFYSILFILCRFKIELLLENFENSTTVSLDSLRKRTDAAPSSRLEVTMKLVSCIIFVLEFSDDDQLVMLVKLWVI